MSQLVFEVVLIAILIIINGLFSMTEIAVVSSRRVRLASAAEGGSRGAAAAIDLQQKPDRFLSAVQIGITLVGILSGAFGGAMLSGEVAGLVATVPALEPYASTIAFGFVIVVITYFSLVIGELVPKNIALAMPERIATLFARPMKAVSAFTSPIVWILSGSTRFVLKILRIGQSTESGITEDEIKAHIAHGTEIGVLEEVEQELIESVIRLDDQRVTAVMTPRLKIDWIDIEDGHDLNKKALSETRFSRLPICRGDLDDVVGIAKARDILTQVLAGQDLDLEAVAKEPVFVPETMTALEMLEKFKGAGNSLALVIDEFGSVTGLVTLNDILEEIVGDLPAGGIVRQSVTVRDDGSMLIDGQFSMMEVAELLKLRNLPEDEFEAYHTLAGFVLARLERVPAEGDSFEWDGIRFEVMDMDGRRVDKVLVVREPVQL
ncbi:MAG: hemolysin family protein [Pyrinomonadaceae bacterium]|nr:hemolysin family protein [Pyrinomonadaceae bacterium]